MEDPNNNNLGGLGVSQETAMPQGPNNILEGKF